MAVSTSPIAAPIWASLTPAKWASPTCWLSSYGEPCRWATKHQEPQRVTALATAHRQQVDAGKWLQAQDRCGAVGQHGELWQDDGRVQRRHWTDHTDHSDRLGLSGGPQEATHRAVALPDARVRLACPRFPALAEGRGRRCRPAQHQHVYGAKGAGRTTVLRAHSVLSGVPGSRRSVPNDGLARQQKSFVRMQLTVTSWCS